MPARVGVFHELDFVTASSLALFWLASRQSLAPVLHYRPSRPTTRSKTALIYDLGDPATKDLHPLTGR